MRNIYYVYLSVFLFVAGTVYAEEQKELPVGHVISKIVCTSDKDHSYALYIPGNYDHAQPWPIIYCFSPNAAGIEPVNLLAESAEKYGYIVAGSNNAKNGEWQPIRKAIKIMVKDIQKRLYIHPTKRFAMGFSGGARMSYTMAHMYRKKIMGIIPCGAGFGEENSCPSNTLVFAICGTEDGNLSEVESVMKKLGYPKSKRVVFETFSGGHNWPPKALLDKALGWMDKKAKRRTHCAIR